MFLSYCDLICYYKLTIKSNAKLDIFLGLTKKTINLFEIKFLIFGFIY